LFDALGGGLNGQHGVTFGAAGTPVCGAEPTKLFHLPYFPRTLEDGFEPFGVERSRWRVIFSRRWVEPSSGVAVFSGWVVDASSCFIASARCAESA